jgi:hypothetical protein
MTGNAQALEQTRNQAAILAYRRQDNGSLIVRGRRSLRKQESPPRVTRCPRSWAFP